jgi:hypothetical protein
LERRESLTHHLAGWVSVNARAPIGITGGTSAMVMMAAYSHRQVLNIG